MSNLVATLSGFATTAGAVTATSATASFAGAVAIVRLFCWRRGCHFDAPPHLGTSAFSIPPVNAKISSCGQQVLFIILWNFLYINKLPHPRIQHKHPIPF